MQCIFIFYVFIIFIIFIMDHFLFVPKLQIQIIHNLTKNIFSVRNYQII